MALLLAGFWYTLALGQIYTILALVAVLAWLLLPRRPVLAGLLIGLLVAVKPNFALWPLLLLVSGAWLPALAAGFTAGVLSGVPVLLYGTNIYCLWLQGLRLLRRHVPPLNASLPGLLSRLGLPWLALPASCVLVLALLFAVRRRRPSATQVGSLALIASLVVSPLAWVGYTVILLPELWANRSRLIWPATIMLSVPPLLVWNISQRFLLFANLPYVSGLFTLLVSCVWVITCPAGTEMPLTRQAVSAPSWSCRRCR